MRGLRLPLPRIRLCGMLEVLFRETAMATYLVRRVLVGIVTLLVITCFVYGLARAMPGTPLTVQLGEDPSRKLNPEDQERLRRIYGLDKPWYAGYLQWLGNVAQGDLGRSITRKQPVTTLIAERIGPTFLVSGTALVLIWLMAIPLGLYASRIGRPMALRQASAERGGS